MCVCVFCECTLAHLSLSLVNSAFMEDTFLVNIVSGGAEHLVYVGLCECYSEAFWDLVEL